MTHTRYPSTRGPRRLQGGFSLIELMVAVAIALFLIGGMATILQHNRTTSLMQSQLVQMQDSERLAMTQIAAVVESAGYFPNPFLNTANGAIQTAAGSLFAANGSPVVFGVKGAVPPGDSLTVRYAAGPPVGGQPDNVFNCQGATNQTGAVETWENTFSVNAQNQLVCSVWSWSTKTTTPAVLVDNVQSMTVLYGVQTNAGATASCTDTYMDAAQVNLAGAWANVCSAVVTLTFFDLTYPKNAVRPTVSLRRVIPVMQMAGMP